jgi:hypothetical protein
MNLKTHTLSIFKSLKNINMKRLLFKSIVSQVENHNYLSVLKEKTIACGKKAQRMLFLPILIMVLLLGYNHSMAETNSNPSLQDSIPSKSGTPILIDSTNLSQPLPNSTNFAIGSGGSFGGIGIKVGKFHTKNEKLRATYGILGLGGYLLNETYQLGVVASAGRRYYFPDKLFFDAEGGIHEYKQIAQSLRPVLGVKMIAGYEFRGKNFGLSLGLGISQNVLFDYTTRPALEIGLILGNLNRKKTLKQTK